jgi:hypothetical protein
MKIICRTLFDITATGITGHHKSSRIPFHDRSGQHIVDALTWNRGRNQQRNWETITQLIQLRTQLSELTDPVAQDGAWQFEFGTERDEVFSDGSSDLGSLLRDCEYVPMLTNLNEVVELPGQLVTQGADQNIWFEIIS